MKSMHVSKKCATNLLVNKVIEDYRYEIGEVAGK